MLWIITEEGPLERGHESSDVISARGGAQLAIEFSG